MWRVLPLCFLALVPFIVGGCSDSDQNDTARAPSPSPSSSPLPTHTPATASLPPATPLPTRPPTATPSPSPTAVSGPTFVVNKLPVGCHEAPSASAAVRVQRPPGSVQAVDQSIRLSDGTWHRENTLFCWTRTEPREPTIACVVTTEAEAQRCAAPFAIPSPPPPTPIRTPQPTIFGCPQGCASPPPGCFIKGNISFDSGEKIYHVPGGRFYDATVISPGQGERWFCTEQEAINNGWRRSLQ